MSLLKQFVNRTEFASYEDFREPSGNPRAGEFQFRL